MGCSCQCSLLSTGFIYMIDYINDRLGTSTLGRQQTRTLQPWLPMSSPAGCCSTTQQGLLTNNSKQLSLPLACQKGSRMPVHATAWHRTTSTICIIRHTVSSTYASFCPMASSLQRVPASGRAWSTQSQCSCDCSSYMMDCESGQCRIYLC
jgi:hypothetical protein